MKCDKAHHVSTGDAPAKTVLKCAWCGKVYARCAECEKYAPGNAANSMAAHVRNHANQRLRLSPDERCDMEEMKAAKDAERRRLIDDYLEGRRND